MGVRGDRVSVTGNGLTGPTGGTDDTVLRFTAANTVVVGTGVTVADTAASATVITITNPGVYHCLLQLGTVEQAGITTTLMAITLDSSIVTGDPTYAGGALVLATSVIQLSAGVSEFANSLDAFVQVTKGSTAIIRFQASNGAGAAPTALNTTTASFQIFKISSRG
jgi:hypothetical protein